MREQAQAVDEDLALRARALEVEREHGRRALREVFLRELVVAMLRQFRVVNGADESVRAQKLHHLARVGNVPLHAHWQRLDALQNLPGTHRRHAGTEVAQPFATAAQQKSGGGRFLGEHHVVKAVIRRGQRREVRAALVGEPVEAPAIHQQATDHHAVPLQELGGGVKHDVGTMLEWPDQIRCGQRRIEHQWHAHLMRDGSDSLDVDQQIAGIAQRFAKEQPRVRAHCSAPGVYIPRVHERRLDAEARQRVVEQVV